MLGLWIGERLATVLVIDDSGFQRKILHKILSSDGYEVAEATSGEDGLEKIEALKPDLITLDLVMPELDGIGVLTKLKEMDNRIPVIVISADIQDSTREECLGLGAVAFVNKPVKGAALSDLQNLLKTHLA